MNGVKEDNDSISDSSTSAGGGAGGTFHIVELMVKTIYLYKGFKFVVCLGSIGGARGVHSTGGVGAGPNEVGPC